MLTRLALVLLLLSACAATPVAETVPGTEPEMTVTTTPDSLPPALTTSTMAPTTTTTTLPSEPYLRGLDLAEISLRSEGDGLHPDLTWDAVPGAETYTVLVMDPDGRPWWSWSGPQTSVVLGGIDTEADIAGPARRVGVTWTVFAYDAEWSLVGVGALHSLEGP